MRGIRSSLKDLVICSVHDYIFLWYSIRKEAGEIHCIQHKIVSVCWTSATDVYTVSEM